MIPFIGMYVNDQIIWSLNDFVLAGILLCGVGFAYIGVQRVVHPRLHMRFAIIVGIGVFLCWLELAVGVFGSPFAGS